MKYAPLLLAMVSCLALAGRAAGAPKPPATLLVCSRMADPGERLQCYDTQMAAMGATVATTPPAATAAPATANAGVTPKAPPVDNSGGTATTPPAPTPQAKFGEDDLKLSARPKEAEADKVLVSTITTIKLARPELYIIVLANGQIWMQENSAKITMFFRAGYDVRIEKGLFGRYKMWTVQTGEKNWVSVTRIQ